MTYTSLAGFLALTLVASPASAAIFDVNSVVDAVDATIDGTCASATGECTLRAAIQEANATPLVDDVINVPAGKYTLKLVGANENAAATGDLDLLGNVQINGAGAKGTVIKGKKDRVFHVVAGVTATISNLTVSKGKAGEKGQIGDEFNGGGIFSENAATTLQNVVVAKNQTSDDGGGIAAIGGGTLTLTDVLISGNKAADDAGGIDIDGADATLTNVTVAKNKSADDAGGIEIEDGTLTMVNSTVSGNKGVENAGGVSCEVSGTISLTNVTIKGNKTKVGGGGLGSDGACSVTIHNVLLDKNKPDNCAGVITLAGGNLDSGGSSCLGDAPQKLKFKVAGLKSNGGATPTHAIKEGSPAIDHGFDCPPTDQRGFPRVGDCDTGAFEFQGS